MTPEEALSQFEQTTGLRVAAIHDPDSDALWWQEPPAVFVCTVGDRTLHVDELATGGAAITDHAFRTSGGEGQSNTGVRGGIGHNLCAWLGSCNRPRADHITVPDFRARRTTAPNSTSDSTGGA